MKNVFRKAVSAVLTAVMMFGFFTTTATDAKAEDNLGSAGRLYFANGYSVALNYADAFDPWQVQAVTDAWDSACVESFDGSTLIADHDFQGFNVIKYYGVGSIVTIVDPWGGSTNYVCVSYYSNAYWYDGYTVLPDGRDAWYGDTGLWMKTCNSDGTNTVSYWTQAW